MFGVKQIEQRSPRGDKTFWATRGKRGSIKPNGFFHPMNGKRSLKPNGLFGVHGGKRSSLKPNSFLALTAGKRSSFKPNIILKPNGLFSLTKRSEVPIIPGIFDKYDTSYWTMPTGLFGAYKRTMKPNGIFNLSQRAKKDVSADDIDLNNEIYEYYYDDDRESQDVFCDNSDAVTDDLDVGGPEKRKDDTFWATRGKRSGGFWAVRG